MEKVDSRAFRLRVLLGCPPISRRSGGGSRRCDTTTRPGHERPAWLDRARDGGTAGPHRCGSDRPRWSRGHDRGRGRRADATRLVDDGRAAVRAPGRPRSVRGARVRRVGPRRRRPGQGRPRAPRARAGPDRGGRRADGADQAVACGADPAWCRNATGTNVVGIGPLRERVAHVRADLRRFRESEGLDRVVVVNLGSTEAWPDLTSAVLADLDTFEKGLDADESVITPGMIYCYVAITEGCPYVNFTPSFTDVPALLELAEREGVP